jgi:hypothetical protein
VPDYSHTTPRHQARQHPASASMPGTPAGRHLSTFQMHPYSYQPNHQPFNGRFPGGVASPTPSQSPKIPRGSASLGVQTGDIRGAVLPSGFVPLQAVSTTEVCNLLSMHRMYMDLHYSCMLQSVTGKITLHEFLFSFHATKYGFTRKLTSHTKNPSKAQDLMSLCLALDVSLSGL